MAGERGLQIPIVLDFTASIRNIAEFRQAAQRAFTGITGAAQAASAAGTPLTPRQATAAVAKQAGVAEAQIAREPGLDAKLRQEMLAEVRRQVTASTAQLRRTPGLESVREPTANAIAKSREAEERRITRALARTAAAEEKRATKAERDAAAPAGGDQAAKTKTTAAQRRTAAAEEKKAAKAEAEAAKQPGPSPTFTEPLGIRQDADIAAKAADRAARSAAARRTEADRLARIADQRAAQPAPLPPGAEQDIVATRARADAAAATAARAEERAAAAKTRAADLAEQATAAEADRNRRHAAKVQAEEAPAAAVAPDRKSVDQALNQAARAEQRARALRRQADEAEQRAGRITDPGRAAEARATADAAIEKAVRAEQRAVERRAAATEARARLEEQAPRVEPAPAPAARPPAEQRPARISQERLDELVDTAAQEKARVAEQRTQQDQAQATKAKTAGDKEVAALAEAAEKAEQRAARARLRADQAVTTANRTPEDTAAREAAAAAVARAEREEARAAERRAAAVQAGAKVEETRATEAQRRHAQYRADVERKVEEPFDQTRARAVAAGLDTTEFDRARAERAEAAARQNRLNAAAVEAAGRPESRTNRPAPRREAEEKAIFDADTQSVEEYRTKHSAVLRAQADLDQQVEAAKRRTAGAAEKTARQEEAAAAAPPDEPAIEEKTKAAKRRTAAAAERTAAQAEAAAGTAAGGAGGGVPPRPPAPPAAPPPPGGGGPPDEGPISIVRDFSRAFEAGIRQFRGAVGEAFTQIGRRVQSAADAGTPFSQAQIQSALARQLGAAQAAITRNPDILPSQREQNLKQAERQAQAEAAAIARIPGHEATRAPTEKETNRARGAAERAIDEAREDAAKAAAREAEAAERSARIEEEKAKKAQATAASKAASDQSLQASAARAAEAARQATTTRRPAAGGPPEPPAPPRELGYIPSEVTPNQRTQFGKAFQLPIPTEADLGRLREMIRLQAQISEKPGGRSVFEVLGEREGLGRQFGLRTALATERDPTFAGDESRDLRYQLTVARRIRELDERSDIENAIIRNEKDLLTQTAQLSRTLEERQIATRQEGRRIGGTDLDEARAADRLARDRDRGRVSTIVARDTTPEIANEFGEFAAANRAKIVSIRNSTRNIQRNDKALAEEEGKLLLADRAWTRAKNEAAQRELKASGANQQGTLIQRAQQYIAQRQGGAPRAATEFLTGRQLLASRALTTASFAASGAILYGGLQFAKELVDEATQLQVQLKIVNSQLNDAGDIGGRSFSSIREEIIAVSQETGVMANQVALVARQLAGAFANEQGVPDFTRGLREAQSGLELGRVTGLPDQEITDSLTAITLAFEKADEAGKKTPITFESIGDTIIGLEERFGVLAPEIVKFTADLAPLGAELGFTVTQLSALGAVAQQVSGRSGAVLSEQFGRILPALADRSADLLLLFQENSKTAAQIPTLSRALAQRDLPAVLTELVKGYSSFTAAQQNTLVSLVGSRREAAAFYALLSRGSQTIDALKLTPGDFTGSQDKRFKDFTDTVKFSFEEAQRSIEEFGISLFEAGLADGLAAIGGGLKFLADGANTVLSVVQQLNEATDGWATKTAGVVAALFVLNKTLAVTAAAYKAVAGSQLLASAAGSFRGRGATGATGPAPAPLAFALGGAPVPGGGTPIPPVGAGARALAGARGFIAANGVGLIAIAGGIALQIRQQGAKDLKEGVDFVREETRKALERGVDPAELRRIADDNQSRLGFFDKLNLQVHGQPQIDETVEREIGKFYKDLRVQQIERIQAAQDAAEKADERQPEIDYQAGVDAAATEAAGRFGRGQQSRYSVTRGTAGGRNPNTGAAIELPGRDSRVTDEFLDLLRSGEDPAATEREAVAFIEAVNDPRLRAALTELQQDFDKGVADAKIRLRSTLAAASELADPARQQSTDELRSAVESGSATPKQLIDRIKADTERLDRVIALLRSDIASAEEDEVDALIEQLNGLLKTRQELLEEVATLTEKQKVEPADLRIRIREALNVKGGDEANLAELLQLIDDLEGIDPQEQLERAFQGLELQAKIAEAADRKTYKPNPKFLQIIARAQIPAAVENSAAAEGIAALLNVGVGVLSSRIVAQIAEVGLDATKISAAVIAARRAMLQRARDAAVLIPNFRVRESRLEDIDADLGALDAIEQALQDMVDDIAGSIEVPEIGNVESEAEKVDPNILARAIAEGNLAVQRARANGDPVQLARLAIEAANIQARFAKDQGEKLQAIAAGIEAQNQLRDALADIPVAFLELGQALASNDAVKSTQFARAAAALAVQNAKGQAARLRAEAAKVNADRAARDAIRDIVTASNELLIAIANAAGDTVEAALRQLAIARQNLAALQQEGAGKAELDRARAEVVSAQAAVRDAQFNDQLGDIEFLLEMERISVQQAIIMLQRLAEIPGATEEMIRSIERRIKQLRDEVNGDLNFNLPDIQLPTLYEVRRLMQSGNPAGTGTYQDNRVVSVGTINIATEVDADQFLSDLADVVGGAPTTGTYPGVY
jgi:hypothetical protein